MPLFPGARLGGGAASGYGVEQITNTSPLREATVIDFPRSLIEFQQRFSDEEACAKYLFAARWPQAFVCPGCGNRGERSGFWVRFCLRGLAAIYPWFCL